MLIFLSFGHIIQSSSFSSLSKLLEAVNFIGVNGFFNSQSLPPAFAIFPPGRFLSRWMAKQYFLLASSLKSMFVVSLTVGNFVFGTPIHRPITFEVCGFQFLCVQQR